MLNYQRVCYLFVKGCFKTLRWSILHDWACIISPLFHSFHSRATLILGRIDILKFHGHLRLAMTRSRLPPPYFGRRVSYQDAGFWPLSECGTRLSAWDGLGLKIGDPKIQLSTMIFTKKIDFTWFYCTNVLISGRWLNIFCIRYKYC
jgi:hypothetical protein